MKHNREYEIAWQGLKPGVHTFQYEIDDRFMADLDVHPEFKDLSVRINLVFDKKTGFFLCHFDVDGSLRLPCDRCGDEFDLRLWDEFDLVIKLTGEEGGDPKDDEADLVFIPRSETVIDMTNWIYEFIMLSIPLQRVHPDLADGKPGCNPEALKLLENLNQAAEHPRNDIWKGLHDLKEDKIKNPKSN